MAQRHVYRTQEIQRQHLLREIVDELCPGGGGGGGGCSAVGVWA